MTESRLFLYATIVYCATLIACVVGLSVAGLRDALIAPLFVVYRVLIVVPLATALACCALIMFDLFTPGDWLYHLTADEEGNVGTKIGVGIVVSSLIISIFWMCVQG